MERHLKPRPRVLGCVETSQEKPVKTATQMEADRQWEKIHEQQKVSPEYPTTYDTQDCTVAFDRRPKRTSRTCGNAYLTALSAQRDQWETSSVKGGRDATRFTWSPVGKQHSVRKGPDYYDRTLPDQGMKTHDRTTTEFYGARDRAPEVKRAAPPIRAPFAEDPATNPKERVRPTDRNGTETVYGTDAGGGAMRGRDYEAFAQARNRQYTVSTLATRAGTEYKSDGLGVGASRGGGAGRVALATDSFHGARLPGGYERAPGVSQARTTAPTDFAEHQLATRAEFIQQYERTSSGVTRSDMSQGESITADHETGGRVRSVGNFQLRGFGGVGRSAGGAIGAGMENKGWTGSRLRSTEMDHNAGRVTTGNGQQYGGSTTYGADGGFNRDRTRTQEIGVNRHAVGAPAGLFAGSEVNLQQGGRHPITGSMESKPPIAGRPTGKGTAPDSFGLPDSCPRAITLFSSPVTPPSYGGGSMLGSRGSLVNDERTTRDSEFEARTDMDGSKRSRIIQDQVKDSMVKMKAMSDMGLVLR